MRVAYDAGPLVDPPTGVGRYTRELGRALEAAGVDLRRYAVALGGRKARGIRRARVPARLAQAVWRRFDRPCITRLTGAVDVVHGTNFVLPALGRTSGVVTVHDLSFLRSDTWPGGERLVDLVPWSIRRAARVLTPTRAIAEEVSERYGLGLDRIDVTPEGVSGVFFGATPLPPTVLEGLGIAGPFAIAAGTIEPRKNLRKLLAAWRAAAGALEGWTLVLAGPRGWGEELPPTPGVRLLGWVGDETLPGLYAAASFFCYPSLYEGFGLPPLEAMAAGTPALAGRYSAAPEVLKDAALLVDSSDTDALAGGLQALATDAALRKRLALKGRTRAAGFTWEGCAAATRTAYAAAVKGQS